MRTNLDLDDHLIQEGSDLTGVRTKKESAHLALTELIRVRKKIPIALDYDVLLVHQDKIFIRSPTSTLYAISGSNNILPLSNQVSQ